MKKLLLGLVALGLLLSACGSGARLKNTETQLYSNEAGYHILLPAQWEISIEDEDSTIFRDPENAASLTLVNELGGEAYYGLDEITEMLLQKLESSLLSSTLWQPGRVLTDTEEKRRQVFSGVDTDGATVYLDISILQPHPGIRYYLLFAAGSAAYNAQSRLFADIVASFEMEEDVQYLYGLMEERRENNPENEAAE